MSGVTLLTCLADWQNNSHAIDGENPTVKLREKQQDDLFEDPENTLANNDNNLSTVDAIAYHIKSDKNISPVDAETLTDMFKILYERFVKKG